VLTSGRVTIVSPPTLDWSKIRSLTLIHPDGIVPGELPGSTDGRCLSIALRRLTFLSPHARDRYGEANNESEPPLPRAAQRDNPIEGPLSDRDMILQFEGLGGTSQGCEFGLVQRALGAEPLSLLRWTHMDADALTAALEADFEGVGTPAQTVLDYFEWPTCREYRTSDRRFLMSMHTWVKEDEKPYDAMFEMMCRRLTFLRGKLLDDLANADKIFVFKMGNTVCTAGQIARMHRALRRHGPNTLLYVRVADDAHPNGAVDIVQDGLMIGYISQFNETPDGQPRKPDVGSWRVICREAHRHWRQRQMSPERNSPPRQTMSAVG
jgi:hypothetical protein